MAIPKIETNAIAAETEKRSPVIRSANSPPLHATGMLIKLIAVSNLFFTAP